MAAIITEKFRVHNARQFKEDFGEAASQGRAPCPARAAACRKRRGRRATRP